MSLRSHRSRWSLWLLAPILLGSVLLSPYFVQDPPSERERYERYLAEHSRKANGAPEEGRSPTNPGPAVQQDFLATMDPDLKRPTPEKVPRAIDRVDKINSQRLPGESATPWVERGPDNVGGRTRAIMFDPNDASQEKVWAGGVTGGLWYTNDITSTDSSWYKVNDFWDNLAVTCIAHDPNDPNTFYVGTGESFYAGSSRGAGIWKSTNGGDTWTQLSSTTDFYYVTDLLVRNEGGNSVVYAGVNGANYKGVFHTANEGLQRSTDGGSSWNQVLPNAPNGNPYAPSDLELASDNRIWMGTRENTFSGSDVEDRGGGRIFWSDDGTSWSGNVHNPTPTNSRVEIATAPSDANYVYGIMASSDRRKVDHILYTSDKGTSWTTVNQPDDASNRIPSTDFSRSQAYYDLIIQVDPNDPNTIVAGAINLHRSTDNGTTWDQISKWSNNPDMDQLNVSMVHADQHEILFRNGNSDQAVFGTDGGVFYTDQLSSASSSDVIDKRVKDYNVTQFYACSMHPDSAVNEYYAGSQDNGTQRFTSAGMNSTNEVLGGDGAYNFVDDDQPQYKILSIYYNSYYLLNTNTSNYTSLQSDRNSGNFINAADYDSEQNVLYSGKDASQINVIKNVISSPTIDSISISGMGSQASAFEVSPYTTSSTTLFVGTEAGRFFRVDNAESNSPSSTELTGSSFPTGNISCIEMGQNENEILVTFSNYGVNSVWYSDDGGSTWTAKEGDLNDIPVRWALFNPNNYNEAILATEVGVWRTTDLSAASPSWTPSNSGLAKVRVDMLRRRTSDDQVIAATHGRGLFSSSFRTACVTPSTQPGPLTLNVKGAARIDGSFDTSGVDADGYLVVRSTNSSLSADPTDGTDYNGGDALGGGTVVKSADDSSFVSNGLNDGTSYYYFVYAYDDAGCTGGPAYNKSSPLQGNATTPDSCQAPSDQPQLLILNATNSSTIEGKFDTSGVDGDGYLVVRSTNSSLSANPADGTDYNSGDALGGGTVVQSLDDSSFTSTGLNSGSTYYYFVFAFSDSNCAGGPVYNTNSPLQGSETVPYPACSTPLAQPSPLVLDSVGTTWIEGHFDSTGTNADHFLVVRSSNSTLSSNPSDGTSYSSGDALGGGTVVQASPDTSFKATGLASSSTYHFFVFSFNDSNCSGGPDYKNSGPTTGTDTTLTPCSAPGGQAWSLSLNPQSSDRIDGSFYRVPTGADGYLIVRSTSSSLSTGPSNGTAYSSGDALGGGTVVKSRDDSSFSASGLNANTLYYFFVYAYDDSACTGGPAYVTPPLSGHEATERTDGFCTAISHPGSGEHISRVKLGSIDNSTGIEPKGYGDYSNLSTQVHPSNSYALEVRIDTDGDSTDHVIAFVDWDQDKDFQDSEERFDLGDTSNVSSAGLSTTIDVPSSAMIGQTRMRIVQAYGSDPDPCIVGFEGEVEEYSIEVKEGSGIEERKSGIAHKLFPNPNDGSFQLEVPNPERKEIELSIFGPKGKEVLHREHGPDELERRIELGPDAANGNYLLRLRIGDKVRTSKFVVER